MIVIFSTSTSLGVGLGWIFVSSSPLISGVFLSIAAGTFIYIAASEIVVEEFAIQKYKWGKYFAFMLGVGPISAYFYYTDRD